MGLYPEGLFGSFDFFSNGNILEILNFFGNFDVLIVQFIRCVMWGAKIFFTFFSIFEFKRLCPVAFEFLCSFMYCITSLTLVSGRINISFTLGFKFFKKY